MGAIIRTGSSQTRSKEDIAKLSTFMSDEILSTYPKSSSIMVKQQYLRIHSLYNIYCNESQKALKYSNQAFKLFETNPAFQNEFPEAYTSNLQNRLILAYKLNDKKDFDKHIAKFFEFENLLSKRTH